MSSELKAAYLIHTRSWITSGILFLAFPSDLKKRPILHHLGLKAGSLLTSEQCLYRQSSAYRVLYQHCFLNNTVYFGTLICPFSTKSLLRLHGFLLTRLFFQSLKNRANSFVSLISLWANRLEHVLIKSINNKNCFTLLFILIAKNFELEDPDTNLLQ